MARAYRQLRVCPLSTTLLGISLNNNVYIDIVPPFGCRTSALACARTTCAIVWLLRKRGFFALCYLDDLIGIESSRRGAGEAYSTFLSLAKDLRLDLALCKHTSPAQLARLYNKCGINVSHTPFGKNQRSITRMRSLGNKTSSFQETTTKPSREAESFSEMQ